jgi:hypothetical protein
LENKRNLFKYDNVKDPINISEKSSNKNDFFGFDNNERQE